MDKQMNETAINILNVALRVFSKKGFNAATTREIAHEAGVAEGTIFRYFPTKKDILITIADVLISRIPANSVKEKLGQSVAIPPDEALRTVMRDRLDFLLDNYFFLRVLLIETQFEEISKIRRENIILPVQESMAEYLTQGIANGIFRTVDVNQTAELLVGLFAYYFGGMSLFTSRASEIVSVEEKEDLYAKIDAAIDIILNGLRKGGL